jgi:hypothetical protein
MKMALDVDKNTLGRKTQERSFKFSAHYSAGIQISSKGKNI